MLETIQILNKYIVERIIIIREMPSNTHSEASEVIARLNEIGELITFVEGLIDGRREELTRLLSRLKGVNQ